jgi:hypothetical protein
VASRGGVPAAALAYFTLVFLAGFFLGTVRVLLVVPALGERWAELLEMPLMVLVSLAAARWVVGRFRIPSRARDRLAVGCAALLLLLLAEVMVVVLVQRISLGEYFRGRDPIAGGAYALSLLLFALMPWLAGRAGTRAAVADGRGVRRELEEESNS